MKFLPTIKSKQTFEARPITVRFFNLFFSRYTWLIIFLLLFAASVYGNYHLIRDNYAFRCEINGEKVGLFIHKAKCDELQQDKFDSIEYARIQRTEQPDPLGN